MPKVWNKRDPKTPKEAVYVGRPTKWGNPYVIGKDGTRAEVIEKYRAFLTEQFIPLTCSWPIYASCEGRIWCAGVCHDRAMLRF